MTLGHALTHRPGQDSHWFGEGWVRLRWALPPRRFPLSDGPAQSLGRVTSQLAAAGIRYCGGFGDRSLRTGRARPPLSLEEVDWSDVIIYNANKRY